MKKLCWMAIVVAATTLSSWAAQDHSLTNASFESGNFDGWQMFGKHWRTSANMANEKYTDAHSGTMGAVNDVMPVDTDMMQDEWRGLFQSVRAKAGKEYIAGAWIKSMNTSSTESYVELQFLDKAGQVIKFVQSDFVTSDQDFTWVVTPPTEAPQGTESANVRGIVHMIGPVTNDPAYHIFDDFEFKRPEK
ncbi:MAG TPA: hypothetical protein DCZ95_10980 [Verrucomicrobia bacterium]|nr:MAG: hypothetical protein A2X46_08000 [Lentisphaerae bacterium GWF2_57_35]HBA84608.1 hypothetical protein [Verrucomicrobiota bacterium]